MTNSGDWIIYNSAHPEKSGVWKIHPDGSGAKRIIEDASGLPEVSPDGRYVLYTVNVNPTQSNIKIASVEDEGVVPFEIECRVQSQASFLISLGRARWLPSGDGIAYVCGDEEGGLAIFVQDFRPGHDTTLSRVKLTESGIEGATESFGIAPDGQRIVISKPESVFGVVAIDNLADISSPGD